MIPFNKTLLSQYANSPVLLALINGYSANFDPSANIDAFYNNVWNIDTANGVGLDLLGRIIDVSRIIQIPAATTGAAGFFGFAQQTGSVGFGQGVFYNASPSTTGQYPLPDDAYRALILLKAVANIGDCSIPTLNRILGQLFSAKITGSITGNTLTVTSVGTGVVSVGQAVTGNGVSASTVITGGTGLSWTVNNTQTVSLGAMALSRGNAWIDNGRRNMNMQIRCDFFLQAYEIAILKYSGVFPIPTGVGYSILEYPAGQTFGFSQQTGSAGFGQGILFNGGIV